MTFGIKNKEIPKLIRFEDGRTIKDQILSMSRREERQNQTLEHWPPLPATWKFWEKRQHLTSYNTHLNLPTTAFDGSHVTQESPPNLHSTSSTLAFYFPVGINSGWLHKSVIHPYQHKYWNIFISQFYYHSTRQNS